MRVLHVTSGIDPKFGGPAAATIGLAGAQADAGLGVTLVSTYAAGEDLSPGDVLRGRRATFHAIGPCTGALRRHPGIQATLERLIADTDIVHVHALWEEVQHRACRVAQRMGKPYLMHPCGMLDPWSLSQGKLKKWLYMAWRLRRNLKRAVAIHVATEMEGRMVSRLGLAAPNIVEPNGIALSEYETLPPPGTFRNRYPQLAGRRYVAYLGRIHPLKGLELLVPAISMLADKSIMLVVIGPDSGNFKSTIVRITNDAGIADRVIFAGILHGADKIAALADADLLALPSYHENFGGVVVEALAAGVPVVVSDHVYIHREISAAEVGGVCPLDAGRVAAELTRWLNDPGLRKSAAARARPFAWEHYDWMKIARRWESHYRSLARGSGPAGGRGAAG